MLFRSAAGLADLALYEGRYAAAAEILEAAIAREMVGPAKAGPYGAGPHDEDAREALAAKYLELAEARIGQGRRPQGIIALGRALETSRDESVLLPAARIYLTVDRRDDARALGNELSRAKDDTSRAYGRIIDAELALDRGDTAGAIDTLRALLKTTTDSWIVRFVLGNAYVQEIGRAHV